MILLICPFLTFLSHICNGLLPMLYRMDKNPDWKVFLNMFEAKQNSSFRDVSLSPLGIRKIDQTGENR